MTSHFNGWGTHQSECHFRILMDYFLFFFDFFSIFSPSAVDIYWVAIKLLGSCCTTSTGVVIFCCIFCCDCLHPSTFLCPALEFGANWSSQLSINHEIYSGHQTYCQATAAATTTTTANCPLIGCWYRLTVFVFEICPLVAWQWYFGWTLWMDAQCLLLLPPNHWEHQHQQEQPLQPVAREWQRYNEVFVFGVV